MVGDVLNWSLSRARCLASGLCVFPGDEGGVFSTIESQKGLARPKQARDLA